MKFLADESVDFPVVQILRRHGFDVRSVAEEFPSKDDEYVLDSANLDGRVLITADKDFGELVYRLKKVNRGVILLRMEELSFTDKATLCVKVIRERKDELQDAFVVIRKEMIRIRKL